MFADHYTEMICKVLNRSYASVSNQAFIMGLKKSNSFMEMELNKQGKRLKIVGFNNQFKKGTIAHNKGQKMSADVYEKAKPTMFKKGIKPHNSLAPGTITIRTDKRGIKYYFIKVEGQRILRPLHIHIWQENNGPIPAKHNIVFKDKNTMNCTIDNLECISNTELMNRNTITRFPKELRSTIHLLKKVKNTINEK